MKESYFLIEYSYINRGKLVIRTAEDCARSDAYNVLWDGLRMSRIVTIKKITKLARKPHPKHLEPLKCCYSYQSGQQWGWEYID